MKNQLNQLITNQFDSRGFELFINQNTDNQWLSADDVASWMFETNSPTDYQLNIAIRFLNNASTEMLLGNNPLGVLEKKVTTLSYQSGKRQLKRTKPVYRLADASLIDTAYVPETLEAALDLRTYQQQVKTSKSWQRQLDSLPF